MSDSGDLGRPKRTYLAPASVTIGIESDLVDLPKIPLSMSAIVSFEGDASDGAIVRLLQPALLEIRAALRRDPGALMSLTPRQLEELIAAAYDSAGFDQVILTPRSGDFGRDVIATKNGWGSVRIIDQVKAYKAEHRVTANDVRALLGVLHGDRSATKGVVTTTSEFAPGIATDPFIAPFMPYRLELINGKNLVDRLRALSTKAG